MGLFPIWAYTHFGKQGHFELGHAGHQARQCFLGPGHFSVGHFEHQFVVNLHHHAGGPLLVIQGFLHRHHGQLDEVGRRALHGGVDGLAFSG